MLNQILNLNSGHINVVPQLTTESLNACCKGILSVMHELQPHSFCHGNMDLLRMVRCWQWGETIAPISIKTSPDV